MFNDTMRVYFCLCLPLSMTVRSILVKFGTQLRSKAMRILKSQSDLAKGVLTFSIQTNEMPADSQCQSF